MLLIETSEEMPSDEEVYRMLRNMGERGLLAQFAGVIAAKPKAWHTHAPLDAPERATFRAAQAAAVVRAVGEYAPGTPLVIGPDFGHTDPQIVFPYGGVVTIDGPARSSL